MESVAKLVVSAHNSQQTGQHLTGQHLRYKNRSRAAEQDWTRFPVSGVSYEDAVAYAARLDHTRRIPGARLCDEYERERAARGADGRTFPTGATLELDDANIDVTYGRDLLAVGPDEVGHIRDRAAQSVQTTWLETSGN